MCVCVCVFSHWAPVRSQLPLAADLQLTRRLGHWHIRQPTQLWCHGNCGLRPIDVNLRNLAADDLAVLNAWSTPPAAIWPLPHIPAVSQSQKSKNGQLAGHHNRCGYISRNELSQAEFVPALSSFSPQLLYVVNWFLSTSGFIEPLVSPPKKRS